MRSLLESETAAAVATVILAVVLAALDLDGPRWDARFGRRQDERDQLVPLLAETYAQRRPLALYEFVADLRLPEGSRARDRLVERVRRAEALPPDRYAEGCSAARRWLGTVGEFARRAATVEELPLRQFMQTYHLGVIREGELALPFVVSMHRRNMLTPAEVDQAAWGVALKEAAVRYNSLVRHQREAVYFRARAGLGPVGPIVWPPAHWSGPLLTVWNSMQPQLRLRSLRHHRAARRRLRSATMQLRTPGPPSTGRHRRKIPG